MPVYILKCPFLGCCQVNFFLQEPNCPLCGDDGKAGFRRCKQYSFTIFQLHYHNQNKVNPIPLRNLDLVWMGTFLLGIGQAKDF